MIFDYFGLLLIRCEKKIKNNQKIYHKQKKILALVDLLGFAAGKKRPRRHLMNDEVEKEDERRCE